MVSRDAISVEDVVAYVVLSPRGFWCGCVGVVSSVFLMHLTLCQSRRALISLAGDEKARFVRQRRGSMLWGCGECVYRPSTHFCCYRRFLS